MSIDTKSKGKKQKGLVKKQIKPSSKVTFWKKIDYKYFLAFIVAAVGVYFTYITYQKSKLPEIGRLKATASKCTFFLPSDFKSPPQIQFEIYFINDFKYNISVRPENGSCILKKNSQLLNFYTNSNKMLYLGAGESKTLTYLSDFDINIDYTEINNEIFNSSVTKALRDFKIGLSLSTGQSYLMPILINDSTMLGVPECDTINKKNNNMIQFMILMCPPGRWSQYVTIEENNINKIDWLIE